MQSKMKEETVKEIVEIDKDLDDDFRETIYQTMGFKRGNIRQAFHEAIGLWIKEKRKSK